MSRSYTIVHFYTMNKTALRDEDLLDDRIGRLQMSLSVSSRPLVSRRVRGDAAGMILTPIRETVEQPDCFSVDSEQQHPVNSYHPKLASTS